MTPQRGARVYSTQAQPHCHDKEPAQEGRFVQSPEPGVQPQHGKVARWESQKVVKVTARSIFAFLFSCVCMPPHMGRRPRHPAVVVRRRRGDRTAPGFYPSASPQPHCRRHCRAKARHANCGPRLLACPRRSTCDGDGAHAHAFDPPPTPAPQCINAGALGREVVDPPCMRRPGSAAQGGRNRCRPPSIHRTPTRRRHQV